MTTVALRRGQAVRAGLRSESMAVVVAGVAGLLLVSLYLRTHAIGAAFWIDEGLSVGISSHPLTDIPGVLRQDGSPPLYYLLLHGWMELFGRSEAATQALSLVFGVLTVPAALWAGRSLAGPRAGWLCAALAAVNPFLSVHAQDARMYSLLVFLGVLGTATFLHAFAFRRRQYLAPFALTLAAMLYTHNWSLFFAAGAVGALAVCLRDAPDRRRLARDALLSFGAALLLYAPWIPSLVYQALHTGAPWSMAPSGEDLLRGVSALLGGNGPAIALLLGAGAGLAAVLRRTAGEERTAFAAAIAFAATVLASAWLFSQISPAWAFRYLAVPLGPLLVLAGLGLARARGLGLAALAVVVAFWAVPHSPADSPTEERAVASEVRDLMRPGDLVIVTHPERVPVMDYYLPAGLHYATPLGPVDDPGVMDWRDALPRLETARTDRALEPLLDAVPPGGRVMLVTPLTNDGPAWQAPWTSAVARRSVQWSLAVEADRRFELVGGVPAPPGRGAGVEAMVYAKREAGRSPR